MRSAEKTLLFYGSRKRTNRRVPRWRMSPDWTAIGVLGSSRTAPLRRTPRSAGALLGQGHVDPLLGLLLRQRPMSLRTVVTAALASGPLGVVLGRSLRERRRLPFAGPGRLLQKLLQLGDAGFEPANRGALPGYDRLQLDDSTSLWGGVGSGGGRSGPGTRGRRRKPLGQRLPSWGRTCRR